MLHHYHGRRTKYSYIFYTIYGRCRLLISKKLDARVIKCYPPPPPPPQTPNPPPPPPPPPPPKWLCYISMLCKFQSYDHPKPNSSFCITQQRKFVSNLSFYHVVKLLNKIMLKSFVLGNVPGGVIRVAIGKIAILEKMFHPPPLHSHRNETYRTMQKKML